MSIFTTLRDAVLGTTPQRVIAQRLAKIEATEADWQKVRDMLRPLAVPGVDAQPGNAPAEAVRCIEARDSARVAMLTNIAVSPRGESYSLACGAQFGKAEAEARCRIAECAERLAS